MDSLSFDTFKATVCEKIDADPDKLPEGLAILEYPEQEADGEYFECEYVLEFNRDKVVGYYPDRNDGRPNWTSGYESHQSLDTIDLSKIDIKKSPSPK